VEEPSDAIADELNGEQNDSVASGSEEGNTNSELSNELSSEGHDDRIITSTREEER